MKLRYDWEIALDQFQSIVTDLIQDENIGLTCTTKIHVIFWHVREHCKDEIALRPDEPRGLGRVSTQTAESMHHRYEKYLERFNPHWNCPDLLVEELYRATTSWAGKCLWPASDDGDQQN